MEIQLGAKIIVNDWLNAKQDEVLHFITDENHHREAAAFEQAAFEAGAVAKITFLPSGEIQDGQIFEEIQNVMSYADAIIGATHFSFITTSAVDFALKRGARFLSLPLHSNDGSSVFACDFIGMSPQEARKHSKTAIRHLKSAKKIRVKTDLGTDMVCSKENREVGLFHGSCAKKRTISSSSFELYVPIVETMTEGTLVVDGSLGYLGLVKEPLSLVFSNGYLSDIEKTPDGERLKQYIDSFHDHEMYCAAEFGIGLNAKAQCRGISYIEDESTYGTFHVGFGRNLALGGNHDAEGHFDVVIHRPDIWADEVLIMKKGEILK